MAVSNFRIILQEKKRRKLRKKSNIISSFPHNHDLHEFGVVSVVSIHVVQRLPNQAF